MNWSLHRDANLAAIEPVWRAAEAAGTHSVFQSFTFARDWAACFADETDFYIAWRTDPPAIVPLVCRKYRWSLLGEGLFDYQQPVGTVPPALQREAGQWVRSVGRSPVMITGAPEAGAWPLFWEAAGLAPIPFATVPLRPAGEDSLAREHVRVERRWQAARVQLQLVTVRQERNHALAWLLDRKAEALAAKGQRNVLCGGECRWMVAMVEHEPHIAELWLLRRGAQVLAGLLCWLTPAMRYAYTIAYDPHSAALSPGILALYALLRHTMREGRAFNFLTGEQAFKQRFATTRENLLRYQLHDG